MRYCIVAVCGILVLAVLGCSNTAPSAAAASEQEQVKAAFVTLQKALKDRNVDQVWDLLDKVSQADAEKQAKAWKDHLGKAEADKVKKDLGITLDELAKLNGKSYLRTEAFFEKEIEELVQTKEIQEVKIDPSRKDEATVYYLDPKGERDHVKFFRQGGKWLARLKMEGPPS